MPAGPGEGAATGKGVLRRLDVDKGALSLLNQAESPNWLLMLSPSSGLKTIKSKTEAV